MPDIMIRGLSANAVARIDAAAETLGLSRNEYLRRTLEPSAPLAPASTTADDLRRASAAVSDLLDPDVMDSAWR